MMKTSYLCLAFLPAFFPFLSAQEKIPLIPGENPAVAEIEPTNFIRDYEDDKGFYLQTAVTSYKKDGIQVDLIGAIHIADLAYYQELNKEFATYPVVLYEMVGGENIKKILDQQAVNPDQPAAEPKKKSPLSFLSGAYSKAAEFLQLSDQRSGINYRADNFVHADLTLDEFQNLQKAKKETLIGTLLKGSLKSSLKPQPKQPSSFQLLLGFLKKEPNRLKKELLPTLANGDETSTDIFGESVIIADRNAKCLQVLNAQIAEGQKKIAVFYGAAHYPDLEKSLLEEGFKQSSHRWLNAWAIPKVPESPVVNIPEKPAIEILPETPTE